MNALLGVAVALLLAGVVSGCRAPGTPALPPGILGFCAELEELRSLPAEEVARRVTARARLEDPSADIWPEDWQSTFPQLLEIYWSRPDAKVGVLVTPTGFWARQRPISNITLASAVSALGEPTAGDVNLSPLDSYGIFFAEPGVSILVEAADRENAAYSPGDRVINLTCHSPRQVEALRQSAALPWPGFGYPLKPTSRP